MTRKVSRSRHVDPYSIDLGALDAFCERISARFDGSSGINITIKAPDEEFDFEDVAEMYNCNDLPETIHKFQIHFLSEDYGNSCFVYSPDDGGHRCTISANADNEGWCADVIETAASFLKRHRTWYFFVFRPSFLIALGFLFPLLVYVFTRLIGIINGDASDLVGTLVAGLVTEMSLFVPFFISSRLSPPTATISRTERGTSWPRRYQLLMLLVGSLTALAAVIAAISGIISLLKPSP